MNHPNFLILNLPHVSFIQRNLPPSSSYSYYTHLCTLSRIAHIPLTHNILIKKGHASIRIYEFVFVAWNICCAAVMLDKHDECALLSHN